MTGLEPGPQPSRRLRRWLPGFVLGPRFARRLVLSHALVNLGDAMINVSLVGSLFLSVSLDASRSRIMAYLLLAAAPLVLIAPVAGSVLDRARYGYRVALSGSQLVRAVVSVALVGSLLTVALYPLTFVVLIARKVYALAKAGLLSQMTNDSEEFLRSDAQLARTGTVVGVAGTGLGGLLLATDRIDVMLLIAAPSFVVAALISWGLPPVVSPVRLRSVPRMSEAIPGRIGSATVAVSAVRAAGGASTVLLALAIKRGGGDEWIYVASLVAAGTGGLVANLLAPQIHRVLSQDWVLVLALTVPGITCAVGVQTIGSVGVIVIAFSIGLAVGVGTRAVTILNASVPLLARGRSIARSELFFQVASLIGALLAVLLADAPSAGFAALSVVLIGAGLVFGFRRRHALRLDAAESPLGDDTSGADGTLPEALVLEAQRLAARGAYRMSVVVAALAVDVAREREPAIRQAPEYVGWEELRVDLLAVRADDVQPADRVVLEVLALADALVARAHPLVRNPSVEPPPSTDQGDRTGSRRSSHVWSR